MDTPSPLLLQYDGYRPVVVDLDQHMGPELPTGYGHAVFNKQLCHPLHQGFCDLRGSCLRETGSSAFAGVTT